MSYTLRGRLESRVAAGLLPLAAAAVLAATLREWWPLILASLMLGVGFVLDAAVLHRLFPYQPGWAAVPLGALELGAVMGLTRLADVQVPLVPALALFGAAWLFAQLCGHALFPRAHLTYAEDGGELGRAGPVLAGLAVAVVAFAGGIAWATQPPTLRLEAGVHSGPLVLAETQTLVGEPGAIVRGGILIRADDVEVRNVTVEGGEVGILVEDSEGVVLDGVTVLGSALDGISARQSSLTISDCVVRGLAPEHTQGIDISFAAMLPASRVEGCSILGGAEGITTQMAHVEVRDNVVVGTMLRAISLNEMSMGTVERNVVRDAVGIGILCMDYSMCEIEQNLITGTRADPEGGKSSAGHAIVAHYGSAATIDANRLRRNSGGVAAFVNSTITPR